MTDLETALDEDAPIGEDAQPSPPSRTEAPPISRYWGWALWSVVAIGIALRLRQWWFDRSIWGDEAAVALQFIQRSYLGLTHPLGAQQGAPWGWLWLEKLSTQIVGESERSLRLVPLLSGVAMLVFAALLARRLLRPAPAVLSLVLLAVVEPLVYYSNDIKQYQTDAAVTAAALYLMLVVLERGTTRTWIAVWGVCSTVFVLCSQPAIFTVGVATAILALRALQHRRFEAIVLLVVASLGWVAVFGAEYVLDLRTYHRDPAFAAFWKAGYPALGASADQTVHWVGTALTALVPIPLGLQWAWLIFALFVIGWVRMLLRHPDVAVFVAALLCLAVVAAVIRAFPLDGRLALYLDVPVVLTIAAAGGPRRTPPGDDGHGAHRRRPSTTPDLVASACLCLAIVAIAVPPIRAAAVAVKDPYVTVESRPAIQFILSHWEAGDRVFVEAHDVAPAIYYHQRLGLELTGSFELDPSSSCSSAPAVATMRGLADGDDIWLLFGYPPPVADTPPGNTVANLEAKLEGLGTIIAHHDDYGPVAAVEIDPSIPATAAMPDSVVGCVTVTLLPTSLQQP